MLVLPVGNQLIKMMVQDSHSDFINPVATKEVVMDGVHFRDIIFVECEENSNDNITRIVLKCAIWEAKHHIHMLYNDEFKEAVVFLHLIHRFGRVTRLASMVSPSNNHVVADFPAMNIAATAVERLPVEMWREVRVNRYRYFETKG